MKTVKMTVNKPLKTFNVSIPLDMKVNDVRAACWLLCSLLGIMTITKPTVDAHNYVCIQEVDSFLKEEYGTDFRSVSKNLISMGYEYKGKGKKGSYRSGGALLVTGYSFGIEEQEIQTRFGDPLSAFLDGSVDIAGMFDLEDKEMQQWIEQHKDEL